MRKYNKEIYAYEMYRMAKTVLRTTILNAVEDKYICHLKHHRTLYARVDPYTILEHLWKNYGTVDVSDLTQNDQRMRAQWNPPTPIEALFEQLQEGKHFAKRGNEDIPNTTLVKLGYENIQRTGLFTRPYQKWRKKAVADQTW